MKATHLPVCKLLIRLKCTYFVRVQYQFCRRFLENKPAILFYFLTAVYFAVSAYQIQTGYPKRVLGLFMMQSHAYINYLIWKGCAFILIGYYASMLHIYELILVSSSVLLLNCDLYRYMFVPFLFELRVLLDWLCVPTSLEWFQWLQIEDVTGALFRRKCLLASDEVCNLCILVLCTSMNASTSRARCIKCLAIASALR